MSVHVRVSVLLWIVICGSPGIVGVYMYMRAVIRDYILPRLAERHANHSVTAYQLNNTSGPVRAT